MRLPEQREQENIQLLQSKTEQELATWMLHGMELNPIWYKDDRNNVSHLLDLWNMALPDLQLKMNRAVTIAVQLWEYQANGSDILCDLAIIAGMTENAQPTPRFIEIIDTHQIPIAQDEVWEKQAYVVSVVVGFAHDHGLQPVLERWFNDPQFAWQHTALLLIGLVSCAPNEVERWMEQSLHRFDEHEDYFVLSYITSALYEYVGENRLTEILQSSKTKSAKEMLRVIPQAREIHESSSQPVE